ncbi:hypothetical protein BT69DRAFT_356536 [Atractiella rhizophila]|nr:hypothetical protein BT69DRAFT_356536 [Atractiella rhizophila]
MTGTRRKERADFRQLRLRWVKFAPPSPPSSSLHSSHRDGRLKQPLRSVMTKEGRCIAFPIFDYITFGLLPCRSYSDRSPDTSIIPTQQED